MKLVLTAFITLALFINCVGLNLRPSSQQLTDADLQAIRQVTIAFSRGFIQRTDIAPLIKDHFAKDFIQRYTKSRLEDLGARRSTHLYFVPGLEYDSRLLSEATPEDWLRFYMAAHNFLFFGTMSLIKNLRNVHDDRPTPSQLYPASVINLLNTNPTLANMIVRKGSSKPVGSVAEMQKVTAILEQAVSLMRESNKGQAPLNFNEEELSKAMREDEFFAPKVATVNDGLFGVPRGTQVVFIRTPVLFRLTLVKANDNRWEILWADPDTGG